jgi:NADH-quinone oxidoreductase subunit M
MDFLSLPFLSGGLLCLAAGAIAVLKAANPRATAAVFASLALAAFAAAAVQVAGASHARLFDPLAGWLEADALDAVPMVFFAALTLAFLLLAPRRDAQPRQMAGMLLIALGTQTTYAAANLSVLAAGWWITAAPFFLDLFGKTAGRRLVQVVLAGSCLALTAGLMMLGATAFSELSHMNLLTLSLLMLAVVFRKGMFPFHSWLVSAFEQGPLLPMALLFNGHLGALLVARSELADLSPSITAALHVLATGAIVTALLASLRAFVEKKPRRLLALVCVSQASFILSGLATANAEGITGALVHWLVVAAASSGLVAVVRALEVRTSDALSPRGYLGLAVKAPRLATFFLISGLALIGLPGTVGYCAEDLLFHGALASHPVLGIALPLTTAFNAINLMRLFGLLFLGVLPKHVIDITDALPRERWPLAACVVFLIGGGLLPSKVIGLRTEAARAISESFNTEENLHHALGHAGEKDHHSPGR